MTGSVAFAKFYKKATYSEYNHTLTDFDWTEIMPLSLSTTALLQDIKQRVAL